MSNTSVQYTPRQLEAVSSTKQETLVSAAAGSGKTFVLTKRIEALTRGADLEHFAEDNGTQVNPDRMANMDNMLVMTFTRAAASEMRKRIIHSLREAAQTQPQGSEAQRRLYQQAENAAGADICTIHSFCSRVIGENYERAGIAPRVTVLADTQREHLIAQTMRELFDALYEVDDPGMMTLLHKFTTNGNDSKIADYVLATYEKMMGTPDWEEWLDRSTSDEQLEEICAQIRASEDEKTATSLDTVANGDDVYGTGLDKIEAAHEDVRILVDIVRQFEERFSAKKRAINKVDFNDLEHLTLKVLRSLAQDGEKLKKEYHHIFVDEYQDTNPVQEAILEALAAIEPNATLFEVGDLKQSIYGFRGADTSNFKRKQHTAIHMNDNFRSSPAVIDTVNALMECLMTAERGDVSYGENEALVCGVKDKAPGTAQILLAQKPPRHAEDDADDIAPEAYMIADKIQELHRAGRDYKDIAILARSKNTTAYTSLPKVLDAKGIPYWTDTDTFQTFTEIDLFLNLLELIVNERRDVPLLSVLRSYMYNLTEKHFAAIRNFSWSLEKEAEAKQTATEQAETEQNEEDKKKPRTPFFVHAQRFFSEFEGIESPTKIQREAYAGLDCLYRDLKQLRTRGTDMALDKFVDEIAAKYDFSGYLLTRPNGGSRKQTFETLLDTIREQQTVSGNSLYRVLSALREKRESDGNDKKKASAVEGAIRIMTMHKSKGLEFPVVFLANLDHEFSHLNTNGPLLLSKEYGVVLDLRSQETHTKSKTPESEFVREQIRRADKSEELRLLYVAMTRAKEELYLCGSAETSGKKEEQWQQGAGSLPDAKSMLDWIMGAWYSIHERGSAPSGLYDETEEWFTPDNAESENEQVTRSLTADRRVARKLLKANQRQEEEDLFSLPAGRKRMPAVQSVSKVVAQQKGTEARQALYRTSTVREVSTSTNESELQATERGTSLHEALQYAVRENRARMHPRPGEKPKPLLTGIEAVHEMADAHLISPEVAAELTESASAIDAFLTSSLYERVQRSDKVLIEQRFTLLMPAGDGYEESAQMTRLQGRIDLAFLEDGAWVLVDYKSDRQITQKGLKQLYSPQMAYYKRALEQTTKLPVKDTYLFSLAHKKELRLSDKDLQLEETTV